MPSTDPNSAPAEELPAPRLFVSLVYLVGAVALLEATLAIVLVVLPLQATHGFSPRDRVPTVGETVIDWKYRRILDGTLVTDGKPVDVLLGGDSSALMGLVPSVISEELGVRALNLAGDGSYTYGLQTDLLEDFIRRFGAPKVLVLQLSMHALAHENLPGRLEEVRTWHKAYTEASSPWRLPSRVVIDHLRLERENPFGNEPRGRYPSDHEMRRILEEREGFLPSSDPYVQDAEAGPYTPTLHEANLPRLRRLFAVAAREGFQVLVVFNPVTARNDTPQTHETYARLAAELGALAAPFPGVVVTAEPLRIFPNDHGGDPINVHLIGEGPRLNSTQVAAQLEPLLR